MSALDQAIASLSPQDLKAVNDYLASLANETVEPQVRKKVSALKTRLLAEAVKRRLQQRKQFHLTVQFLADNAGQHKVIFERARILISLNTPEKNVLQQHLNTELLKADDFGRVLPLLQRSADFSLKFDHLYSKMVSLKITSLTENAPVPFDVANVEFRDDEATEFLFNRHIEYVFDPQARTWVPGWRTEYIIDNYLPRSCFPTILIDTYRDSLYKYSRGKKPYIDYEYFAKLKGLDAVPADGLPFTLNDINRLFLTPHRIQLIVLDIHYNVIYHNADTVPDKNHNITPNPLYVFAHNGHIYRCTKPTKDMCQLYKAIVDPKGIEHKDPPPVYKLPKSEKNMATGYIRTTAELTGLIAQTSMIPAGKRPSVARLATPDVQRLLLDLVHTHKYEPKIKISPVGKVVQAITLKADGVTYSVQQNVFDHVPTPEFDDVSHYARFVRTKEELFNALVSPNTKSYYSESVASVLFQKQRTVAGEFANFGRTPVHGRFPSYNPFTLEAEYTGAGTTADLGFDFVRQYTKCLMMFDEFPVLSVFDEFIPYVAAAPINPRAFYLVAVQEPTGIGLILASKTHELVSGYSLLEFDRAGIRYAIDYVLTPHKYVKNTAPQIIAQIYADDKLTSQDRKNIVNIVVGQTLKLMNRNVVASLYVDKAEASHYHANHFPIGADAAPDPAAPPPLFVGYDEKSRNLIDGFYFIGLLVYEFSRIILYRLAEAAQDYGTVVGCKVDCVFVELHPDHKPFAAASVGNAVGPFHITNTSTFSDIGSIKLETKAKEFGTFIRFRTNDPPVAPALALPRVVVDMSPEDEFKPEAYGPVFEVNTPTIVLADTPGAGKTSAAVAYAKAKYPDSHLFVAPFNRLRQDLKNSHGVHAITLDKLIGRRVGDEKAAANRREYNLSATKLIVFDEMYLHNVKNMSLIYRFMRKHTLESPTPIKFLATGDIFQNEPLEDGVAVDASYYEAIVRRLFPRVLMLHENKRLRDPAQRVTLKRMLAELKDPSLHPVDVLRNYLTFTDRLAALPKDADHIVFRNDTADFVNTYFGRDRCFALDEYVLCRQHFVVGKTARFYVNVEYKITAVNGQAPDRMYTLKSDEGEKTQVTEADLRKYFKPPFAATGHSLQGLTRGEKVVIYDVVYTDAAGHVKPDWVASRRWLIAAVTRCRTLDVTIYSGDEIPRKPGMTVFDADDRKVIEQKLRGYAYQDRQAKRNPRNNITADETIELIKRAPRCHHCGIAVDSRFTLDRVDDHLPHTRDNCVISCLSCNHRHLNRGLAEFNLDA